MPARVPWRLVGVIAAVLLLTLVTIGAVRACAAPRALTSAQYDKLMKSGTLAGIANDLTVDPGRPTINLEQQRESYLNVGSCTTYWTNATTHLLGQSSGLPTNPDEAAITGFDTELWDDTGAAAAAVTQWNVCLQDFQEVSKAYSYPLKVVDKGVRGEVTWQYAENTDLRNPYKILTLRARNVIATFELPDAPEPGWRSDLIAKFAADIAKYSAQ